MISSLKWCLADLNCARSTATIAKIVSGPCEAEPTIRMAGGELDQN